MRMTSTRMTEGAWGLRLCARHAYASAGWVGGGAQVGALSCSHVCHDDEERRMRWSMGLRTMSTRMPQAQGGLVWDECVWACGLR